MKIIPILFYNIKKCNYKYLNTVFADLLNCKRVERSTLSFKLYFVQRIHMPNKAIKLCMRGCISSLCATFYGPALHYPLKSNVYSIRPCSNIMWGFLYFVIFH
jgi:hypothetical protein